MDPNANLREQNELLHTESYGGKDRRAELRRALLSWLSSGGFEPNWSKYPEATKAYRKWVTKYNKFQDLWR